MGAVAPRRRHCAIERVVVAIESLLVVVVVLAASRLLGKLARDRGVPLQELGLGLVLEAVGGVVVVRIVLFRVFGTVLLVLLGILLPLRVVVGELVRAPHRLGERRAEETLVRRVRAGPRGRPQHRNARVDVRGEERGVRALRAPPRRRRRVLPGAHPARGVPRNLRRRRRGDRRQHVHGVSRGASSYGSVDGVARRGDHLACGRGRVRGDRRGDGSSRRESRVRVLGFRQRGGGGARRGRGDGRDRGFASLGLDRGAHDRGERVQRGIVQDIVAVAQVPRGQVRRPRARRRPHRRRRRRGNTLSPLDRLGKRLAREPKHGGDRWVRGGSLGLLGAVGVVAEFRAGRLERRRRFPVRADVRGGDGRQTRQRVAAERLPRRSVILLGRLPCLRRLAQRGDRLDGGLPGV